MKTHETVDGPRRVGRIVLLAALALVLLAGAATGVYFLLRGRGAEETAQVTTATTAATAPTSTSSSSVTTTAPASVTTAPPTPARVRTARIEAGDVASLALSSDGTLWAWGFEHPGAEPDGTETGSVTPTRIGPDTDWVSVASGGSYSLALKVDGSLWAWGFTGRSEPGDSTLTGRPSPVRIGSDTDWVDLAVGGGHSLALKSDRSLWAWGVNGHGQLGVGTDTRLAAPTRVGSDTDWLALAAGGGHSLALKTDGSLWAWGWSGDGQLGDGTQASLVTPSRIGYEKDWVALAAGSYHSLAIKADGSLWAWGANQRGQLGDGTTESRSTPTRIGSDSGWVSVAAGHEDSLAIKADGSLWAWGANDSGQLGDGTKESRLTPTRVGSDADWVTIATGYSQSLGYRADGSLWAWGSVGRQGAEDADPNRLAPTEVVADPMAPSIPAGTAAEGQDFYTKSSVSNDSLVEIIHAGGYRTVQGIYLPKTLPAGWAVAAEEPGNRWLSSNPYVAESGIDTIETTFYTLFYTNGSRLLFVGVEWHSGDLYMPFDTEGEGAPLESDFLLEGSSWTGTRLPHAVFLGTQGRSANIEIWADVRDEEAALAVAEQMAAWYSGRE